MRSKSIYTNVFYGLIFLILIGSIPIKGQEFRATVSGTVKDPQDAIVAGATVTVTNTETNVSSTATTNDDGVYTFPLLQPGRYKLSATAANFTTALRENIQLNVDDRVTIDFQLAIGSTTQIDIVADEELVERGNVTTGTVITERQITELPLSEGAAYNLATQAPGVSYTGNPNFTGPTANGNLAAFRTNGATGNQITLDGSPNVGFDGGVAYTPPADALSQFKIQTNAFDAQNGFTAGSTVNVAVKSGTNDFHGSAYYFDRSKALTANNFFNNRAGQERSDRKYYRYGGQINGPLYFPGFGEGTPLFYDGKDKTFFMFAYEKQYNKRPEPETFNVPTLLMRQGNFSELLSYRNAVGLLEPVVIYDPATARCVTTAGATVAPVNNACPSGSNVTRDPFPGNIIPANRLNPAAVRFLNLYPTPNQPGQSGQGIIDNYFSDQTNIQPYDSYLTRIDHNFNGNHRVFGKFFYSKSNEDRYNFADVEGAITQGFEIRKNIGGSFDYTGTLSSKLIFNVRTSYNDFVQNRISPNAISAGELGFSGIAALSSSAVFPRFDFTNYDTLGAERADFNEGLTRDFSLFSVQPTLTQIFGNHTLKYGYDYRRLMENRSTNGYNAGRFLFSGTYTAQASNSNATATSAVGRDLASFLLGIPVAPNSTSSFIENSAIYDVNEDYHGFFVHDDWRISQRLTLNIGLRYELESGLREANGQIVTGFDTTAASPLQAAINANIAASAPTSVPLATLQNLRGGLLFASSPNDVNQATDKNNFQPRIGISYALGDKTVIRAGYGIFTSPFQIQAVNQSGFTASTAFAPTTNNGLTFLANINNPFPGGVNPAVGSSLGLNTLLGTTIGTTNASGPTETTLFNYDRKNSNFHRIIFGAQRELPFNMVAEATFVYSKGVDLAVQRQLNFIPREYLNDFTGVDPSTIALRITATQTFLNQTVPNPFRGLVPQNGNINGPLIARRSLLTQYPQFQDLIVTEYNGSNTFTSAQFQLNKRISKGLSLNASYSYSRERERVRRLNPQDVDLTDMISTASRPHRFTLSSVFEIPFGRTREYFSDLNPIVDIFLGGWQLNAVYEKQSGEPLVMPNLYYSGNFNELEANIGKYDDQGRRFGVDVPAFNLDGFRINGTVPGYGNNYTISTQNVLRTLPYTSNKFRNQPFQKFDLGLTKNFAIREKMKLQVRFEGINALNWVYFSGIQLAANNGAFGFVNAQRNLPRDIQLGARFTF